MKLLSILFLSVFLIQDSIDTSLKLEDFIFTEHNLPNGCKLKQVTINDRLPCEIKTNPFISSQPNFLNCFARSFTRDSTLIQNIKKGLFSVYEDQSEIGLFGLETDSKQTAILILNEMKTKYPNEDGGELIQAGKILLWLWHDREKTSAFKELKKLIDTQLK